MWYFWPNRFKVQFYLEVFDWKVHYIWVIVHYFVTQVIEVEQISLIPRLDINKNQMSWPITIAGQTHGNLLVLLSFGLSLLIKLDRSLILKSKTFILMPSNDIFERVSSSVFCRYSIVVVALNWHLTLYLECA